MPYTEPVVMHKTALDYAKRYNCQLGRYDTPGKPTDGYYYIGSANKPVRLSLYKTAASAIVMMRQHQYGPRTTSSI